MNKFSPSHYQLGKIQVWDFIADQDLNFLEGNVIKYICRAGAKAEESKLDDLLKARAYLTKLIHITYDSDNSRPLGPSSEVQGDYGPTVRPLPCRDTEDPGGTD